MTTVVWQTQLAKREGVQGFVLPLVLWSSFFPPPGTRTLWYASPLQRSISSLHRARAGGIYKALPWGPVRGCWTSPRCTRTCLLCPLLERLTKPISHRSVLLLQHPAAEIPCGSGQCQPWQQMWKNSHWPSPGVPHPQMLWGLAMIITLIDLPGGSWAELIELKVTANSPCLALLSPHSLVEQLIVFNCHYSEYQRS